MFERLGSWTYRFRFLILIAWIVGGGRSWPWPPRACRARERRTRPPSCRRTRRPRVAKDAIERAFPGSTSSSSATITMDRPGGLTDADRAWRDAYAAWVVSDAAPERAPRGGHGHRDRGLAPRARVDAPSSSDGVLEFLTVNLNVGLAGGLADTIVTQGAATTSRHGSRRPRHPRHGAAGITTDYIPAIQAGTDSTTLVTIVLVVIILLLIYRRPRGPRAAPTIGAAFVPRAGVLGILAAAGWQSVASRHVPRRAGLRRRHRLRDLPHLPVPRGGGAQGDWHEAVRETVKRIGAVISASAATVIVGLAAMAFADFEMIRTTGPALAWPSSSRSSRASRSPRPPRDLRPLPVLAAAHADRRRG